MLASTISHLPRKRPHNQVKKKKDFFIQTRQPVNGVATLRNVVGQRATCYSHKAQSWTRTSLVTLIDLSHRTHEPPSFIHPSFRFFHTRTSEFTATTGQSPFTHLQSRECNCACALSTDDVLFLLFFFQFFLLHFFANFAMLGNSSHCPSPIPRALATQQIIVTHHANFRQNPYR